MGGCAVAKGGSGVAVGLGKLVVPKRLVVAGQPPLRCWVGQQTQR